jgi:hypothetical protein
MRHAKGECQAFSRNFHPKHAMSAKSPQKAAMLTTDIVRKMGFSVLILGMESFPVLGAAPFSPDKGSPAAPGESGRRLHLKKMGHFSQITYG